MQGRYIYEYEGDGAEVACRVWWVESTAARGAVLWLTLLRHVGTVMGGSVGEVAQDARALAANDRRDRAKDDAEVKRKK